MNKELKINIPFIVIVLLAAAFCVRFYAAVKTPLIWDEEQTVIFARDNVSFDVCDLKLPMGGNPADPCAPMTFYLVKLGFILFGGSNIGGRLVFILIGVLSLWFFYKLVADNLGIKTGVLALTFLVFSQFHIGVSRMIAGEVLVLFFSITAVYFFFKALNTGKKYWVYLTGMTIGIGYLAREHIILLPAVFLLFLIVDKRYIFWLKCKETYISFGIMILCMSPYLIWSFKHNFCNFLSADDNITKLGVSFRGIYLYFSEICPWLIEKFDFFVWGGDDLSGIMAEGTIMLRDGRKVMLIDGSNEFPFVHWVLGAVIFIAFGYCFITKQRKQKIISFSLVMFIFVFTVISLVGYSPDALCDQHTWASITIYPGIIFCSQMLVILGKKCRWVNILKYVLVFYLIMRSVYFINIPENVFSVPKEVRCQNYLERAEIYLRNGDISTAIDRCRWVINACPEESILVKAKELLRKCYLNSSLE